MGKIKKDDLEALGELAGFVGSYMNDFSSKTAPQEQRNLFKRGLDPRELMMTAVKDKQDYTSNVIPEDAQVPVPQETLPPQPVVAPPQPVAAPSQPVVAPPTYEQTHTTPAPQVVPQMEFSFIDQQVSEELGSVKDVVDHFNNRLDQIEEWMKIINSFMTEIRKNTEKKPRKPRTPKVNETNQ